MPDRFKPIQPLPEDSIKLKSAEEKMYDEAKKTPKSAMKRVGKKEGGMMKRADGGSVERFTSSDIKKAKDAVNQGGSSERFTSSDVKKAKKTVQGMQDGGLIRMHKQMAMSNKKFT